MANNSEEYFLPHSVHLQFSLIPRLHEEADFRCARRALSRALLNRSSCKHQALIKQALLEPLAQM